MADVLDRHCQRGVASPLKDRERVACSSPGRDGPVLCSRLDIALYTEQFFRLGQPYDQDRSRACNEHSGTSAADSRCCCILGEVHQSSTKTRSACIPGCCDYVLLARVGLGSTMLVGSAVHPVESHITSHARGVRRRRCVMGGA